MDSFLGKWQVQLDKSVGVEELGKLFGWDENKRKMYATLSYTVLLESKGGDTYSAFLDYTQFSIDIGCFNIGQEVEYASPDGTKAMMTVRIQDGQMLEDYRTKEGITWNTVRTIEGGTMVAVTTCASDKSIKCVQELVKV